MSASTSAGHEMVLRHAERRQPAPTPALQSSLTTTPRPDISGLQRALGNRGMQQLLRSRAIQPKLTVGHVDDEYEREADCVATTVMRMPGPPSDVDQRAPMRIQRTCAECEDELHREARPASANQATVTRKCAKCEEEIHRAATTDAAGPIDAATNAQIDSLHGGGQPLPDSVRTFFEPRFGSDLGDVRVHTGAAAAETAHSINARAYTLGRDIVFATGQYAPDTTAGRTLLAHELVHTFQQSGNARRVRRFVECLPVTMALGTDEERCPKSDGEIGRSRERKMFLWEVSNPNGWLVESFAIGQSALKPNLRSNQRWLAFVDSMKKAKDTRWEILGFSDCRGSEATNRSLRKARAQAVFDELPAPVQVRVDSVEAAPLHDCMHPNTAEIGREMNRSAFIRVSTTTLSYKGDEVTGRRPKPTQRPAARTVDCEPNEEQEIVAAFPIAFDMVDKALDVMGSDTAERKALLEKWFNDSSASTVWRVRHGFQRIKGGLNSGFKIECEHKDDWFYDQYCDEAIAYVVSYVGFRLHLCEHIFGRPAPKLAATIVHECSHMFDFTDDEEYCPAAGCPTSLSHWDAIDNADSYDWFAYEAYHL